MSNVSEEVKKIINDRFGLNYILVSYDQNGGYGNRDHLMVHKVGKFIESIDQKCKKLFESTINRDRYLSWFELNKKIKPNLLPKLEYWTKDFGLPESNIDYFFELSDSQIILKKKAMGMHISQIYNDEFPLNLPLEDFDKLFGIEFLHSDEKEIIQH